MSLARLLAEAAREDEDRENHRRTPDALCLTLGEIAARYAAPCPFKPGDLITPRRGFNTKGAGEPKVVVEIVECPAPHFVANEVTETASNLYGRRLDMRVVGETRGNIAIYWAESWEYELYIGPGSNRAETAG